MHRVSLPKLERGERDITITELVGLAAALNMPPIALLFPDVLSDVEVLPNKPMDGLAAFGWFIGAGHSIGLSWDESYAPNGVQTSGAMRIPLELLQIEASLAQQRHSLLQSERGPEVLAMPDVMRDRAKEDAARTREAIRLLEEEKSRLIEAYRGRDGR
ncbi:hypothetical protein [Mycobacterium sp. 852002-10029_SCH5224772]|uniref:hypothetical protein n=1 Tax=Mycobacterium sp. 852002-10029_SCH5224772 TaxID=1834083 RepID=UPI000802455E|nr:hypothetical protein A5775_05850 [Mycobacterium sp. 852002-10029_SCH5224772]